MGGGATTADGPANAVRRGPALADKGIVGATGCGAGKFGSLAVACLMSGGVTRLGLCSGVTGIGVGCDGCTAACFTRGRVRTLGALPSAARKDCFGG